jgi:hypothetical protein
MNAWINLEVLPNDEEIAAIDQLEQALGNIPKRIHQIRELITRFESCHFKYQQHYRHIVESIAILCPVVEVSKIGSNHPRHGGNAWRNDTTGRSRIGRQYIEALHSWLDEDSSNNVGVPGQETLKLKQRVNVWLGDRSEEGVRLVRMLLARLFWQSVKDYRRGGELSELEGQVERIDICNYAFPQNIERLIQGIGKLEPVKAFDGCGTFDVKTKSFISKEFSKLCEWLKTDTRANTPNNGLELGKKEPMKVWLVACLAKTLKESIHLRYSLPQIGSVRIADKI